VSEEVAREVETDGEWLFLGRFSELDDGALHLTFTDTEHSHTVDRRNDVVVVTAANAKQARTKGLLITLIMLEVNITVSRINGLPNGSVLFCSLASVVVCCLSSSVTLPAGGRAGRRARGRSVGIHCTAGQYGYVPLGLHRVCYWTSDTEHAGSIAGPSIIAKRTYRQVVDTYVRLFTKHYKLIPAKVDDA